MLLNHRRTNIGSPDPPSEPSSSSRTTEVKKAEKLKVESSVWYCVALGGTFDGREIFHYKY